MPKFRIGDVVKVIGCTDWECTHYFTKNSIGRVIDYHSETKFYKVKLISGGLNFWTDANWVWEGDLMYLEKGKRLSTNGFAKFQRSLRNNELPFS